MPSSMVTTKNTNGGTVPSAFLHKQLDITSSQDWLAALRSQTYNRRALWVTGQWREVTASKSRRKQMERREFVTGLIGTAAALSASSSARVLGANDRVNVGLIGCGGRGRYDANLLRQIPMSRSWPSAMCTSRTQTPRRSGSGRAVRLIRISESCWSERMWTRS